MGASVGLNSINKTSCNKRTFEVLLLQLVLLYLLSFLMVYQVLQNQLFLGRLIPTGSHHG